ncbi:MAG: cell division protein FtsA [Puniceicoccales bacterium]|jgi:cell division protein FtsA|nr:cell division protein FtsA [Puniceicoccales bacterium]
MSPSNIIAAIDIGTSKTIVLIGEVQAGRRLNIIGMGELPTRGMRKGEITDLPTLKSVVHDAIHAAEESAGIQVPSAYLSLSGYHLSGQRSTGVATVSAANGRVSMNDINRAVQEAKGRQLQEGRVFIHHIKQPYFLDGEMRTNPLSMAGQRLEASFWAIDADESYVRELIHIPSGYGLRVSDLIVSSMASGAMVVDEPMKTHGVLVVDIGGGTTDYVLYRKGYVICTGVLPIGGEHITNDLCLGLRVNETNAEKIKREFGSAIVSPEDANHTIWMHGDKSIGDRKLYVQSINQIINARVDELFTILRRKLGQRLNRQDVAAGVVITGGTAQLRNIDHAAAQTLGIDALIGKNPDWATEDLTKPQYSTVLGLLQYALNGRDREPSSRKSGSIPIVDAFLKLFRI